MTFRPLLRGLKLHSWLSYSILKLIRWTFCRSSAKAENDVINFPVKVASYSFFFVRARADFENLAVTQAFELYAKSYTRTRSKTTTNMASKLLTFLYGKCCVDRLRFQTICRLNRIPYLSLFDLKEKCTRYACFSTNKADLFDRHDHQAGQSKMVYYHTYLQSLSLFAE